MDLEFNFFTGGINSDELCPPGFPGSSLTALYLRANNFSGPLNMANCRSLEVLDIQACVVLSMLYCVVVLMLCCYSAKSWVAGRIFGQGVSVTQLLVTCMTFWSAVLHVKDRPPYTPALADCIPSFSLGIPLIELSAGS